MFKFGFSRDNEVEEKSQSAESELEWIPAAKVDVSRTQIDTVFDSDDYTEITVFPDCTLKVLRSEKALQGLTNGNSKSIVEAESQHSDLIPAKYEGGLKVWECTYDLGKYIHENDLVLENKTILDLGCGAGIIGLIALSKGAIAHFQDYNAEVINAVTIPNVILNSASAENVLDRSKFYSGDWESFKSLASKDSTKKYDFIFTSETIYNPQNHRKLYEVFKENLAEDGVGLIAGKTYYFGVGGGMRQFQKLIEEAGHFHGEVVWCSEGGLQREILKIKKKL